MNIAPQSLGCYWQVKLGWRDNTNSTHELGVAGQHQANLRTLMAPNVLLVANWESGVGYAWWLMENFWGQIADLVRTLGGSTTLIYPRITTVPQSVVDAGIHVVEHDFDDRSLAGQIRLHALIRQRRIRTLYLTDRPTTSPFYGLLRLWGVRDIIVHDHTPGERSFPQGARRLAKQLHQSLPLLSASRVFATTPWVKERLFRSQCVSPSKIAVVQNGITPIGRDPELRLYTHETFGLPNDAVLVVSASRVTDYKRVDFIVACAAKLVVTQQLDKLYFVHCGDGPDLAAVERQAERLGLGDRFVFAGRRGDVRQILQSCDIGIQASTGEVGYSLSILEFMSAGLATLVPDTPSTRQATRDGETGLLFEPGSEASACSALRRLFEDEELRRRIGAAASQSVRDEFNLQETNRQLIAAISPMLGRN